MRRTISGPTLVKSSLPILKAPTAGASSSASFTACSSEGTSSATMIGFRTLFIGFRKRPQELHFESSELTSAAQDLATRKKFSEKISWLSFGAPLEKMRSLKFVVAAKCQGTP